MAVVVKRFTKPMRSYDWDKWSDGRLWRLKQGKDFSIAVRSMRALIYQKATKLGCKVTTSIPDKATVEFQFYKEGKR